jgi:hypothetical protein
MTMNSEGRRIAVLVMLGLAVLAWLLFRHRTAPAAAAGAAPSLPDTGIEGSPDYLTVNVPKIPAQDLPLVPAVGLSTRPRSVPSQSKPGASLPTCGCTHSLSKSLVSSMNQVIANYLKGATSIEESYLANLLSVYPNVRLVNVQRALQA